MSVGLVFALALGLMSFISTRDTLEAQRRETHTFEVISKIKRVSVDINTMQGEVRGYLLTGDQSSIVLYEDARKDYSQSMNELGKLVVGNSSQLKRVKAVHGLAVERIALFDDGIGLKKRGIVQTSIVSRGEALNREINGFIDEMIRDEKTALSNRQAGQELKTRHALFLIASASALSLILIFSAAMLIKRDYARRKRLEFELRESERKYRIVADNTYAWEFWHAPDGRVLYCSPSCKQITGHEAAEFEKNQGLSAKIVHKDDIARYSMHLRNVRESKAPRELEFRIICPDGTEKLISQVCRTISDDAGEFLGIRGTNRDITDLRRLEELIIKNSRMIEDLYNNAPCGYHSLNSEGLLVRMNDTALNWLGYARDEVIGKHITGMMTERSAKSFRENFPGFVERGEVHDLELEFMRRDGSIMPVLLNATAIKNNEGNFLMSRSTFFDLTETIKIKNDLIEKNMALNDALSKVKQLSGMLPICASCKKIRDDEGYWNNVETYIREHSEAEFTHSICPDCVIKLYPSFASEILKKERKEK